MKVKSKPITQFEIEFDGEKFGIFAIHDRWNDFMLLKEVNGNRQLFVHEREDGLKVCKGTADLIAELKECEKVEDEKYFSILIQLVKDISTRIYGKNLLEESNNFANHHCIYEITLAHARGENTVISIENALSTLAAEIEASKILKT